MNNGISHKLRSEESPRPGTLTEVVNYCFSMCAQPLDL